MLVAPGTTLGLVVSGTDVSERLPVGIADEVAAKNIPQGAGSGQPGTASISRRECERCSLGPNRTRIDGSLSLGLLNQ